MKPTEQCQKSSRWQRLVAWCKCNVGNHNWVFESTNTYRVVGDNRADKGTVRLTLFKCRRCGADTVVVHDRKLP